MSIYQKYFHRYKWPFFVAIFCVACEAICDLLGHTLMAHILNVGIMGQQLSAVVRWGGLMLLVTAVGAGFAVTRSVLASRVSQRLGADLRYDCFEKIMGLSESGADQIESGSLITRMTNDTTQVTQFVNGLMRVFLKAPITGLGSIVLASILNFRLSLIIYAVVLVAGLLVYSSMKLSYPRFALLQRAMDRVNTIVQEYLIGVRLVKAFGTYDEESERFLRANQNLMRRGVSSQRVITITSPLITLIVGVGTVLAIGFGGRLFAVGQAQPGDISAFVTYMLQMLTSLMMLTNIFNTFVRTRASTQRLGELFACEDDFAADGQAAPLQGGVELRQVTFTYPNGSGVPALKNVSVAVRPGDSLAIIGPTGSGKSTLCWLLLRFYDVDSGQILLDGTDIRELSVSTVRASFALVPQRPTLFAGTVEDNIRWGQTDASDEAVRRAAQRAQADFIAQMPEGFDSPLGSAAVNISGGQKQRLSIARGLIRHSPVLVLDDATSALDAITEARIRGELLRSGSGQTVILVTQRCTTALFADSILVLENGAAIGYGSHDELMKSCATYQEIYRSQVDSTIRVGDHKRVTASDQRPGASIREA
jgi:ATP-binding cassette subfamily B protein